MKEEKLRYFEHVCKGIKEGIPSIDNILEYSKVSGQNFIETILYIRRLQSKMKKLQKQIRGMKNDKN